MKALVLTSTEGPPSAQVLETESPAPRAGEVRVAMRAAALNHRELWISRGQYPGMKLPTGLGCDGAGVVESVGEGVERSWVGQEVVLYPGLNWGQDPRLPGREFALLGMPGPGTIAEFVTIPAQNAMPKPRHLSFEEAAATPLAALTAWRGLTTKGGLGKGDKVLITGAGGGVAAAALSITVALGALVFVTSSSAETLERCKGLGAQGGFNYSDPEWRKAVGRVTGGIDVVLDGAPATSLPNYIRALNPGARVVIYGSTGGQQIPLSASDLFLRNVQVIGTNVGNPQELIAVLAFMEQHALRPQIDARFSLAEAQRALLHLDQGHRFGKVVISIP
jgi:NADPH:quinone reductase-like Zn-dependent oxidoreductase